MTTLTLLLATMTISQEPPPGQVDVVLKWNDATLNAIRQERTPPPMAARNLAIVHLAIYDAVMAVERTHQPYLISAVPAGAPSAPAAAAAAGHWALAALYPRQRPQLDTILARCLAEVGAGAASDDGLELGRFVAERVLEWRRSDGATNPGRYEVRRMLGLWQPTPPEYQAPLLPEWGSVAPFAMRKGTLLRPPGPPPITAPEYARAYDEVKALGGRQSVARNQDQTSIALFWADNTGTATPPGHWNVIAQDVARQRRNTLSDNARLFALLNVSLADAGIICWVIKFSYDYWRPVTGIRAADVDDNPATDADPDWTPLLDTPPFPSYTSGHSTFSGAAASALANFFGTDAIAFSSTSDDLPGVRRSFAGFWAAAEEAGMSRIYGGIHWQFDNRDGLAMGRTLGDYVARHHFRPLRPQERPPTITLQRIALP